MPPAQPDTGVGDGRTIHLEANDIIVGHASPLYVLVSGFAAGLLIWIPVFVVYYLNKLLTMAGPGTAGMPGRSILEFESIWPYWAGTGLVGVVLAWLRRTSARREWYREIASFRLGLNGVVATIGGAIVCLALIFADSDAGFLLAVLSIGVIIGGFIVNAVWEWAHNLFLRPYGRKNGDALILRTVRHVLDRHERLRPRQLLGLDVSGGKVRLKGVWDDQAKRREVETELRGLPGVALVQFERVDD